MRRWYDVWMSCRAIGLPFGGWMICCLIAVGPWSIIRAADEPPELVLDSQGFTSEPLGLAFSPDGRLVAAAGSKELRLWDVQSGELRATLRGQRERGSFGNCYAAAFSPDGRHLVVGIDDHSDAGSIRVYDTTDLTEIQQLLAGHKSPVRKLAFSRDGRFLASAGDNGRVLLWDWPQRKVLSQLPPPRPDQPLYSAFEFPTNEPILLLSSVDGPLLYQAPTLKQLGPDDGIPPVLLSWIKDFFQQTLKYPHNQFPDLAAFRLDRGIWLATGLGKVKGGNEFWAGVWTGGSQSPSVQYLSHTWNIMALALDSTGQLAATADKFGDVHVWETKTGQRRQLFKAVGRAMYDVSPSADAKQVRFAADFHTAAGKWTWNSYGPTNRVLNLDKRSLGTLATEDRSDERVKANDLELSIPPVQDGIYSMLLSRGGKPAGKYKVRTGATPMVFSFLSKSGFGSNSPVILGDDGGLLMALDPFLGQERRVFNGHEAGITGIAEDAAGKLLFSASTDRTLRIWSLEKFKTLGTFDFRHLSNTVTEVPAGGEAERLGIRVGDRIVSLGGLDLTEMERRLVKGLYDFLPGQTLPLKLVRGNQPVEVAMKLRLGYDYVEPLLNIFLTDAGEWVLWTPEGYYDASPGADRFIGWHVNRGRDKSAKFFLAQQFRKQMYRPDIIDQVLLGRDVSEAIAALQKERPQSNRPDFRSGGAIASIEPPVVKIIEPRDGARLPEGKTKVRLSIQSSNQLPWQQVKLLLNGRPLIAPMRPKSDGLAAEVVEQDVEIPPGKHQLQVIAENRESQSEPVIAVVTREAAASELVGPAKSDLYVLSIGIAKYKNPQFNLNFTGRDASEFASAMARQANGPLYRNVQSKVLIDAEATRNSIEDGLEWLKENVRSVDTAMVFLSAHGLQDADQNYFLSTHEIDPDKLLRTGIPQQTLNLALKGVKGKVIVFANTCYAGGLTAASKLTADPAMELVTPDSGIVVFASSSPREQSFEFAELKHGAFTKVLLDTLTSGDGDANRDGFLSISEIQNSVRAGVEKVTSGAQHPIVQRPPTVKEFPLFHVAKR